MSPTQLQNLEYTILSAEREALAAANRTSTTKALVAPARAARTLGEAADAVREWRQALIDAQAASIAMWPNAKTTDNQDAT